MSFWSGLSQLRTILDTETDGESPLSQALMDQFRENIEVLFQLLLDTGEGGSATSDPSNDTNGYFYDTAGGWSDDEHNGRTLLIISGAAKGNMYTIDDTDDANDRLVCTGDNLYADGVRSGDSYRILFDVKNNIWGHDHDGVNSREVVLPDGTVSAWSDEREVSGSQTGYDTTNAKHIRIFYPGTFTHLKFSAEIKADSGDTAYCRLSDGSNDSSEVSRGSTTYGWQDSSSWDISGLGWTPNSWQSLYVQGKCYAGGGWWIRGVNIVWANS
ncbi:MAG: hypothetical protein JRJ31_16865 [Deltaproteobacteria bacterium]|nr:hypothetical protein [Deltaproteobacteria bacterium]